jgi:DNA-binding transcriptional ArsR family regulator
MATPRLLWDLGTAYDLFVSLDVLHRPGEYGVRGAWAAGMRARLPADARETLEQSQLMCYVPLEWIHTLPEPKDAAAVLWTMRQLPPAHRLATLLLSPNFPPADLAAILKRVAARKSWDEQDQEALLAAYRRHADVMPRRSPQELATILDGWSRSEEFGERFLEALRAYQEVFFAQEEERIRPALQRALSHAQELSGRLSLLDLLEELSQGVRFGALLEVDEVVLAPSYWTTPFVCFGRVGPQRELIMFGARPADASLVPGEVVPDALLHALKALSDPTRLRILRYLAEEPLTPSEIARRLRLRAPTVTHHLRALRLAGLVQLAVSELIVSGSKDRYAARPEAVAAVCASLQRFLAQEPDEAP